jgi:hypothetical protein
MMAAGYSTVKAYDKRRASCCNASLAEGGSFRQMHMSAALSAAVAVTSGLLLMKLQRRSAGCACPTVLLDNRAAAAVVLVTFTPLALTISQCKKFKMLMWP